VREGEGVIAAGVSCLALYRYIVNVERGEAFFLAANIYTNSNGACTLHNCGGDLLL
jgi:hypothetical protein